LHHSKKKIPSFNHSSFHLLQTIQISRFFEVVMWTWPIELPQAP
jgi:hypothetical protein